MFIVATFIAPSAIHGIGCFANEELKPGQEILKFAPGLDLVVPYDQIVAAPKAFQQYMDMYAYISPQLEGGMVLFCDHAKFLNHSDNPNTDIEGQTAFARRLISIVDEITCDYRICCADFSGQF
jgi:SET domain-containing protein